MKNQSKPHPHLILFFISIVFYLFFTRVFKPSGFNALRWVEFLFMLSSGFFIYYYPIRSLFFVKKSTLPKTLYYLLFFYTLYVFITFLRDFSFELSKIKTLIGHSFGVLAWFMPLTLFWGYQYRQNNKVIFNLLFKFLLMGVILYPLFIILNPIEYPKLISPLIWLSFPLLFAFPYFNLPKQLIILLGVLFALNNSLIYDQRNVFFKILVLMALFLLLHNKILKRYLSKFYVISIIIIGILGVVLLYKYSFQFFLDFMENSQVLENNLSVENTRDFLIDEFFNDMNTKDLIIGRGFLGVYFSEFFYNADWGDYYMRFASEIGILTVILKGGLLLSAIYLFLGLLLIRLLFQSKSKIKMGLIAYVLIELLFMFVANNPNYSLKNFVLWFIIGLVYVRTKPKTLTYKRYKE